MAKKKHKKKHSFQHKNAPVAVAAPADAKELSKGVSKAGKTNTMPNEWHEVAADVRRALILAGIFIGLMIALWYFLDVSTFGKNLYNSIQL